MSRGSDLPIGGDPPRTNGNRSRFARFAVVVIAIQQGWVGDLTLLGQEKSELLLFEKSAGTTMPRR